MEFAVGLLPLVLLTMGGFLQPVETCLTLLALLIPLALQQLLTPAAEAKGDTARSAERSGLAEAVENVVALRGCRCAHAAVHGRSRDPPVRELVTGACFGGDGGGDGVAGTSARSGAC